MENGKVSFARVRLLEADPDLGAMLTREDFEEARQLAVPVVTIDRSDSNLTRFHQPDTFGALVLHGMVLRQLRIADQIGMRLLGPGDIVPLNDSAPPMLVVEASLSALPETKLALLGRELLLAARRWPLLFTALELRSAQQTDRLAAQLVICQLPRVDQRLLSLMWLLAESWGRVTLAGTSLPLKLTHEALGALIGARRPTVTLALRELAERGSIVRQEEGWLLLDQPPQPSELSEHLRAPVLTDNGPSSWVENLDAAVESTAAAAAAEQLQQTIDQLRSQHVRDVSRFDQRLKAYALVRERCRETRRRIARERLTRSNRRSPSS